MAAPKFPRVIRPPRMRQNFPTFPAGARELSRARHVQQIGGPGPPPPGFLMATNSASEWIVFWALAVVFNDPPADRVRLAPFNGGRDWSYQSWVQGGRHEKGGSVVDFMVFLPGNRLGIRLQTFRYHLFASARKQGTDQLQAEQLSMFMTVRDLYEGDVLGDATGQKAVHALLNLLGGRQRINPITSQSAYEIR